MKIASLGSLSALAVLCAAPVVHSAVVISTTVNNVLLPSHSSQSPVNLDIDGDGTMDFQLSGTFNNSGVVSLTLSGLNGNSVATVTASSIDFVQAFHAGATVDFSETYSISAKLYTSADQGDSPALQNSFYAGIEFAPGAGVNSFGWLEFSFPSVGGGNATVVRAGYESLDNTGILIPEPGMGSLAGALGLGIFAVLRRRS